MVFSGSVQVVESWVVELKSLEGAFYLALCRRFSSGAEVCSIPCFSRKLVNLLRPSLLQYWVP